MSRLRSVIFSIVTGATGKFDNLLEIGVSTGDAFSSDQLSLLELDEAEFREALQDDALSVKSVFTNSAFSGVADLIEDYLQDITSTTGFLQDRSGPNGSIEREIRNTRVRIDMLEERLERKETRLRAQFRRMEIALTQFQSTSSYLAAQFANM